MISKINNLITTIEQNPLPFLTNPTHPLDTNTFREAIRSIENDLPSASPCMPRHIIHLSDGKKSGGLVLFKTIIVIRMIVLSIIGLGCCAFIFLAFLGVLSTFCPPDESSNPLYAAPSS